MSKKLQYKQNIIKNFCKTYNITKQDLVADNTNYFRYICFKYNDFIKNIELPKIPTKSFYEAVLVEFRPFPHLEFLIRNCILKLGDKWAYTVICGNSNHEIITDICSKISSSINIIKVNVDNMLPSQYSKFLTSLSFWNMLHGEKILIYQEDSILFHKNIEPFLHYDYIGAPFPKYQNDTPNSVGNGGFSLRSKSIMIKILNTINVKQTTFNSCTLEYMDKQKLSFPPEDVYYSKNAQELAIGNIADHETATLFSSESIFNEDSLGGHKFWISNSNWKNKLKTTFGYSSYTVQSDIKLYLKFCQLDESYNKTNTIKNAFDVDLYFCNKVNNLSMDNNYDIIKYIQLIGMDGFIYHPKQLINIFPNIKFYTFLNELFIMHNLTIYRSNVFVENFLYQSTFDDLSKILIKNRYYNLNEKIPLLLLVFIGNEERGHDLINKIVFYKRIQRFNVSFCFNLNSNVVEKMKDKIKDNFEFYAVYECKECGTDITPTMLMYDDIMKRNDFKHIIKLQTKSILGAYLDLTNYLLSVPLEKLLLNKHKNSNCIGHPDYYIKADDDIFNNELKLRHLLDIHITHSFVGGTVFYSTSAAVNKTLQFMKKNYKSYLINNLYENNSINASNSPIHFLERVFGTIKC
jgi:hypothetical protein